jgi:hypothetical protein
MNSVEHFPDFSGFSWFYLGIFMFFCSFSALDLPLIDATDRCRQASRTIILCPTSCTARRSIQQKKRRKFRPFFLTRLTAADLSAPTV